MDSRTFTDVNDKSYEGADYNVNQIKGLLTIEHKPTGSSLSQKPATEINYTYHLHHGVNLELIYKLLF